MRAPRKSLIFQRASGRGASLLAQVISFERLRPQNEEASTLFATLRRFASPLPSRGNYSEVIFIGILMEHDISLERLATPELPSQSSTDLEVLRQQLLHVRQKYEDLLESKRRRIARALLRVRSNNQRRWAELQDKLLERVLEQIAPALNSRLDELTENYLKDLEERIRETLLELYEEEATHLIQKAVERLYAVVTTTNPKSDYCILLNTMDYAKIAEELLSEVILSHKHEIQKGTAVLIFSKGEVQFDWLTPLQNTLRSTKNLLGEQRT